MKETKEDQAVQRNQTDQKNKGVAGNTTRKEGNTFDRTKTPLTEKGKEKTQTGKAEERKRTETPVTRRDTDKFVPRKEEKKEKEKSKILAGEWDEEESGFDGELGYEERHESENINEFEDEISDPGKREPVSFDKKVSIKNW